MRAGVLRREVESARRAARRRPALAAARLAALASPRGDRLRGRRARQAVLAIASELVTHLPRQGDGRPARRRAHDRLGARAPRGAATAPASCSKLRTRYERHRAGVRDGARDRDELAKRRVARRGGRGPVVFFPSRARHPRAARRSSLGYHRAGAPPGDLAGASTARSTAPAATASTHRRGPARAPRRVLGALGHRDRGPATSSRPSASTSSRCARRRRASRATASPRRASPGAATRASTSGTRRSTSCRA